MKTALTKPIEQ